jgi:hypothetical protein
LAHRRVEGGRGDFEVAVGAVVDVDGPAMLAQARPRRVGARRPAVEDASGAGMGVLVSASRAGLAAN